jgi:hypothetical protein
MIVDKPCDRPWEEWGPQEQREMLISYLGQEIYDMLDEMIKNYSGEKTSSVKKAPGRHSRGEHPPGGKELRSLACICIIGLKRS